MSEDIDKILKDIEAEKQTKIREEEMERQLLQADEQTVDKILEERRSKVSDFKLQLNLEDDSNIPALDELTGTNTVDSADNNEHTSDIQQPQTAESEANQDEQETGDVPDENLPAEEKINKTKKGPEASNSRGCLRGIVYGVLVLVISGFMAYFMIVGALDMTGLFRSETKVPVTLTAEQAKDTGKIAQILKKAGVIEQPLIFQLFCKITGADGKFQPQDEASLSPDMGYKEIINTLETIKRDTIKVTFPEGMTIDDIAQKLEDNKVCSASDFFLAMESDKFSYSFLKEIPEGDKYKGRLRKLEGYVFPDSYEFYVGSSGESALRKFLQAFDTRVDATIRAKIKAKGMTLNDTIIMASIIQWEAAKTEDMYKISRVLHNRLENPSAFPKLECDSTQKYIDSITPHVEGERVENLDYDTYKRKGLPIGAICSPGLEAIKAAIDPSTESDVKGRYYFATDMKTGETHYSKTLAEHAKFCRAHNIGIYAS